MRLDNVVLTNPMVLGENAAVVMKAFAHPTIGGNGWFLNEAENVLARDFYIDGLRRMVEDDEPIAAIDWIEGELNSIP